MQNQQSSYVDVGQKVQLFSLMPIYDYMQKEVLPRLSEEIAETADLDNLIAGEVMSLLTTSHKCIRKPDIKANIKGLLYLNMPTEPANIHIGKITNYIYDILSNINTDNGNVAEIKFINGKTLAFRYV